MNRKQNPHTVQQMTLEEIFRKYTPGSIGFIKAVQTHCGMNVSNSEIARLASECPDWWTFEEAWENEFWWKDEANHNVDLIAADEAEVK